MQVTLLGVSIAIILALVAALIGPYFVDWNQYRSAFEAEASRLVGAEVRVTGAIEMRLLPTPSLGLHGVEVGAGGNRARLRAGELSVEFALGPLLRGEIRAAEMRLVGPELNFGLDASGRIDGLGGTIGIDPDRLSIERLAVENGRAILTDAASGARLVIDRLWFNGEVRSLAGPVKGEGGFSVDDERFGYRVVAGRLADDGNLKVKLAVDPVDRPLTIEADGILRPEAAAPRFDGALTLARPAGTAFTTGRSSANVPWRATGQIKVGPANALFEQVEFQYGPDERATKFAGAAEIRFGKSPHLDGVLSARQVDLDRMLEPREPTPRLPLATIRSLADAFGGAIRSPIPTRLGIGIDTVTLAGTSLQEVRGDLKSDGEGWDLETFEFRAPGFTQARVSGRLEIGPHGISFRGPATIDSNDPKALVAWLEGRSESARGQIGLLRASGDVTLGSDRIAIDRLKTEVDRKMVEGRLAYTFAVDGRPPRLEAELKAAELNFDETLALGRAAFAETTVELPQELALAIDVGQATIAGVAARSAKVKIKLDANGLKIERLSVADLGGAMLELSGQIEAPTKAPRGLLTLDVDAKSLDGLMAVLEGLAPQAAESVQHVARRMVPMKARATFNVDGFEIAGMSKSGTAKLGIEATAGPVRGQLAIEAIGNSSTMAAVELRVVAQIAADDGGGLIALLGLARALEVDKRPGSLNLTARGPAGGDLRVDARLAAGGVSASANGTVRLVGENGAAAGLDVSLSAADAAPLLRGAALKPGQKLPVTLRSRASASRGQLKLDDVSAVIAGTPVRGRVGLAFGTTMRIEGRLDADAIDPAALVAIAIGSPRTSAAQGEPTRWSSAPFMRSVLDDASGRIEFAANRAMVTPRLIGRQVRGVVRAGDGEFALEDIEADLGSGQFVGQLAFRRVPDGTAMRARIALANVDAAALEGEARPAVSGRLALQAEIEGSGLSPAALIGSLKGSGTVSLDHGQFAGLDPRVFDAVIRAVDQGLAVDGVKIRDAAAAALDAGALAVRRVDGALTIGAGQLRLANTIARGERADLTVSGRVDLAETVLDARLVLSGVPPADAPAGTRPEIFASLKGPLAAAKRTIDVSALTAWLMLRSVERETKRIEALEGDRRKSASTSTDPSPALGARAPDASRDMPPAATPRPRMIPARPEASIAPLSEEAPPIETTRPPAKPKRPPPSRGSAPRPPAGLSPQSQSIPEPLFWPER